MKKPFSTFYFLSAFCINCFAQTSLPINSENVSIIPSGEIEIEFTEAGQEMILTNKSIDLDTYSMFTLNFCEPVGVDGLKLTTGSAVYDIPKGITSYQDFLKSNISPHWEASNGEVFSSNISILTIKSDVPMTIRLQSLYLMNNDGQEDVCYYNTIGFFGELIHWEASNGEVYEQLFEYATEKAATIKKIYAGLVSFSNENGKIGGTQWAAERATENTVEYQLELHSPVKSSSFYWRYITEGGELRYKNIEEGVSQSILSVNDNVKECAIVCQELANESDKNTLDIKAINITKGTPSEIVTPSITSNEQQLYYNLSGQRIASPNNGIYILKRNGKLHKAYIH